MGNPGVDVQGVPQRLHEVRTDRRFSQRELARRADVSFAHVSRIEKGERKPSVPMLRKLAEALQVDAIWLETGATNNRQED